MIYEIYTENGTKKKRALTGNGYGLPLGTWISYEGNCPDGFIESEQTFNTTTYASLYAMLGTNKVPARFDHSVLSDYEPIAIPSTAGTAMTAEYDGEIIYTTNADVSTVIFINGVQITNPSVKGTYSQTTATFSVKKGDVFYVTVTNGTINTNNEKVRWYKRHLAIKATPAYVEPDTVSDMVNTLRTQDSYSTSEVNTGKKWIDGKPIYRKTYYSATNWPNNTTIGTIANLDMVIEIRDICCNDDSYNQNYGAYQGVVAQYTTVNRSTGAVTVYRQNVFANSLPSTVIIGYTKTTD